MTAAMAVMYGCGGGIEKPTENVFDVSVSGAKEVGYEQGSFDVTITSNVAWNASIEGDVAFSIDNEEGTDDGVVKVSYSENESATNIRTATLIISTTADVTTNSYTINITQQVRPAPIEYTYVEFYKVSGSGGGAPPILSTYGTYPFDGHANEIGGSLANADFTLTFGSGDATHLRIGTNAGNYDNCTLDEYEMGVGEAFVGGGTTYQKAAGLFNRTSFYNIGKIRVTGQYDEGAKLALVYSTDGTTWTLHSDGLHTPAQTGWDADPDTYEFVFETPVEGYFGVVVVATASSGAQRIQDAVVTYYTAQPL